MVKQVFRHGYKPSTINFPYHRSRIRTQQRLAKILGLSGDTQIRTLVRAQHVYFDPSAIRILYDGTLRISRSNFLQVVVAHFNSVRALFRVYTFCQLPS